MKYLLAGLVFIAMIFGMVRFGFTILLFAIGLLMMGCEAEKTDTIIRHYAGPMVRSENLNTVYSDSGKTKMRLEAPVQVEYSDGNQEYEKGLTVTFYTRDTIRQSYLKADFVHFNKQQDLYTAIGHVVLEDLIKHEKLNTEKLHWSRTEGRVFNNQFVEITTPNQILKGKGLTAKQDFSSYTILEPEGQILHADSVDFF